MGDELRSRTGGCLCGEVRYEADAVTAVLHCHCENCRRSSGNFVAAIRADTDRLSVDEERLAWRELGYARYGFCPACGSTLFFRAEDTPEQTSIMVGTLDDASGLRLKEVWFSHEAQPHTPLPEGVPHHAGNADEGNA